MVDKIVGFIILRSLDEQAAERMKQQVEIVKSLFPWLKFIEFTHAGSIGWIWGHGSFSSFTYYDTVTDSFWMLSNSNVAPNWKELLGHYASRNKEVSKATALEGIFNLIRIDALTINVWNDWTGASKVYCWRSKGCVAVSTFEPAIAAIADAGINDISHTSLYSLMLFGSYLGTSTLYRDINVLPPETHTKITNNFLVSERIGTVEVSEGRWAKGWDEIIEEWNAAFEESFDSHLSSYSASVLMLSGGIDSRLIAAIAKKHNRNFHALSYGNRTWQDGVIAQKVAKALDVDLTYCRIGNDYLMKYTKLWCDWFGTSMCVHGMYQFPALEFLRQQHNTKPILTGFTGDPLEGMQTAAMMKHAPDGKNSLLERLERKFSLWNNVEELSQLIPWLDIGKARNEMEAILQDQYIHYDGADYQKIWQLFQWNRVFQFSSYQPIMYEYYFGVITPFVHSKLVNFSLSLPRVVLENRRGIYEMIKTKYRNIAVLPGTYDHPTENFNFISKKYGIPLLLSKRYLTKAAFGYVLPDALKVGPFREFKPSPNTFAVDAINKYQEKSLYPLNIPGSNSAGLFDPKILEQMVDQVLQNKDDLFLNAKLWPIQTVLHRFHSKNK